MKRASLDELEDLHNKGAQRRQILFKHKLSESISNDEAIPQDQDTSQVESERSNQFKDVSVVLIADEKSELKNDDSNLLHVPSSRVFQPILPQQSSESTQIQLPKIHFPNRSLPQIISQSANTTKSKMNSSITPNGRMGNSGPIHNKRNSIIKKNSDLVKWGEPSEEESKHKSPTEKVFKEFRVSILVRRFANKLLKKLQSIQYSRISKHQFQLINDAAFSYTRSEQKCSDSTNKNTWNSFLSLRRVRLLFESQIFLLILNVFISCNWLVTQKRNSQIDASQSIQVNQSIKKPNFLDRLGDRYIFMPESKVVLAWNMINLIMIMFNCFVCLLKIAFNEQTIPEFTGFSIFIYVIECIIHSNTAIFSKGQIINDRRMIINRFTKKEFPQQIYSTPQLLKISSPSITKQILIKKFLSKLVKMNIFKKNEKKIIIGITSICLSLYNKYFNLLFLCRSLDVSKLYSEIENKLNIRNKFKYYSELLKLVFLILSVAHFMGCLFRQIGLLEQQNDIDLNWISLDSKETWIFQYITCIYWAVVTMVTLGYGDIVPKTIYERIFTIVVVLVSCGMFGYCINQIGNLIAMIGKEKQEYNEKMESVERFLKDRNLNIQLSLKIRKHFEFIYKHDSQNQKENRLFLDQMHRQLRFDVCKEIYFKIINTQSLFRLHFSPAFVSELCLLVQEKSLAPDEYSVGDHPNSLYFILNGNISILPGGNFSSKVLFQENKGSILGVQDFFRQSSRVTAAKSKTRSQVAYINYPEFIETIKHFPKDYETFCYIKDLISLTDFASGYDMKCDFCRKFDHSFAQCKTYQYLPNIMYDLKGQKSMVQDQRQKFNRKQLIKQNTWSCLADYQDYAQFFYKTVPNVIDRSENYSQPEQEQDENSEQIDETNSPQPIIGLSKQIRRNQSGTLLAFLKAQQSSNAAEDLLSPKPIERGKSQMGEKKRGSQTSITIPENDQKIIRKGSRLKSIKQSAQDLDIVVEEGGGFIDSPQKHFSLHQGHFFNSQQAIPMNEKLSSQFPKDAEKKLLSIIMNNRYLLDQSHGNDSKQPSYNFMLNEFDLMKEYVIYFPKFNISTILKEVVKRRRRILKMKMAVPGSVKKYLAGIKSGESTRVALLSDLVANKFPH